MKEDKSRRGLSPNKTLELSPRSEAALTVEISIIQNKFKAFCDSSDSMAGMLNVKLIR